MTLNGYDDVLNGYNTVIKDGLTATAAHVRGALVPIGGGCIWFKTFAAADSGTTTSTSANHLVESGQNFLTTITVGMIVRNTTDSTFAYVTVVNSDTDLTLSSDIMTSGEAFTIYKVPYLSDSWAECNGQVLSDASSPFNGVTLPDMNTTQRFPRGSLTSGTTGGANTHVHKWANNTVATVTFDDAGSSIDAIDAFETFTSDGSTTFNIDSNGEVGYTDVQSSLPAYIELVWIMRVK